MRIDRLSEEQLCRTFCEAFSDYLVDASYMTEERIRARALKNNVDFDLSVGAFEGDSMVGFTLIGIDEWKGELAAFDAATGIVPGARGQGLVRRMFEYAAPALRTRGVGLFLLEVLKNNDRAIRAYTKAGFEIMREFACFELELAGVAHPELTGACPVGGHGESLLFEKIDKGTVATFSAYVDWQPSWENSFNAIRRIPGDLLMLGAFMRGECVGTVVYSPLFNWIMTLVVKPRFRRRGVGSGLVRCLAASLSAATGDVSPVHGTKAAAPRVAAQQATSARTAISRTVSFPDGVPKVRMLNVLASDSGMLAFLSDLGFKRWVDQYEMALRM